MSFAIRMYLDIIFQIFLLRASELEGSAAEAAAFKLWTVAYAGPGELHPSPVLGTALWDYS